jgi:hypothetical protein
VFEKYQLVLLLLLLGRKIVVDSNQFEFFAVTRRRSFKILNSTWWSSNTSLSLS